MSEVNFEWNECIVYQHRSIYVDKAQHAAHSEGRHTFVEHGCISDQTILVLFLASLSQCGAVPFREKASNAITRETFLNVCHALAAEAALRLESLVPRFSFRASFPLQRFFG